MKSKIILLSSFIFLALLISGCVEEKKQPVPTPEVSPTATPQITIPVVSPTIELTPTATPVPAPHRTSWVYSVYVNGDSGFYQVRAAPGTPINYNQATKTLYINVSDTVNWINKADPLERLTINSSENLWNSDAAKLAWYDKNFSYTFTRPGKYNFSIQEYRSRYKQTIVVSE